jgi:dTDP-4-dehydrorhamnose 3,5-epimerase
MQFIPLEMTEVIYIQPKVFEDDRGFFLESYHKERFEAGGIQADFVQDNHSASRQGVLRGLHYQIRQAQGKLVQVMVGEIYDVAVDLRRSSPAFGRCVDQILSSGKKNQLWIPPGFAHGFYVLSEWAEIHYKATDYYAPQWERTLLWNDPVLGIPWPLIKGRPPTLSSKDAEGSLLAQAESYD